MSETLFDADEFGEASPERKSRKPVPAVMQPWHEPWKLLSGRHGTIGHHLPKAVTDQGSIITECGVTAHLVGDGRTHLMVSCGECAEAVGL